MLTFPKAKINIGLRITEKRTDGYHNLQTIFYPVGLCDALEFVVEGEALEKDRIEVTGFFTGYPDDENLVIKALKKLREEYKIPLLKIHLHKTIPSGAGLGGGSSDAANFMKCLNRYFNLGISPEQLKDMALSIGSDCPFFIESVPVYAEGRGEIMNPVKPIPDGYHIILVNPGIPVNTAEAYRECILRPGKSDLQECYCQDIAGWEELIFNDFERTVFARYPQIAEIKEVFYSTGALYSSMSGSGSTVYGIFKEKPDIPENLRKLVIYSGSM